MPGVRSSNFSKVLGTDLPAPASSAFREEKNPAMNIRHRIEGNTLVVNLVRNWLDKHFPPKI